MHPGAHAQTQPDRPAIVMGSTGKTQTYAELDAASNRGAQLFRKLRLRTAHQVVTDDQVTLVFR